MVAAGHLGDDDNSKLVHVIANAELSGGTSGIASSSSVSEFVKVVELPAGPAADRPFVGTHMDNREDSKEPDIRVVLTANYGMTVFAGSCVFVKLHYLRKLVDGSFVDVRACAHASVQHANVSLNAPLAVYCAQSRFIGTP
jgi:hypothetical protein